MWLTTKKSSEVWKINKQEIAYWLLETCMYKIDKITELQIDTKSNYAEFSKLQNKIQLFENS